MNDIFKFHLDADICKSEASEGKRLIQGYASTSARDRQDESLVQKGLDISDFVNYGYFNYDHDNSIILGYPLSTCKVTDEGFWVQGELLKGIPVADRMWELALALQKSSAPRKLGFSVEGKVLQRQGNQVVKAKIYNVAITANPVNTSCSWEAIVKSFKNEETPINISSIDKALEVGHPVNPLEQTGGGCFVKEDLEKELHNLSYVIDDEEKQNILKQKLCKKSLTNRELIVFLQLTKGWSQSECKDFIAKHLV